MLEKFKNKKVLICIADYAAAIDFKKQGRSYASSRQREGIVTNLDENFIELDNDQIISIKYITSIRTL